MATSTTTYTEAVNEVLNNISEKQISSATASDNPRVVDKVITALKRAHELIQFEADWLWMYKEAVATSWSTEVATVSDMGRLRQVIHGNDSLGYRLIKELPNKEFRIQVLSSYDTDTAYPLYYTQVEENQFRFNPYPADATRQALITFHYSRKLTFPTTSSGTFEMPERYVALVVYKASEKLAKQHMLRPDIAQAYLVDYEDTLRKYRQQDVYRQPLMNWFGANHQQLIPPYLE